MEKIKKVKLVIFSLGLFLTVTMYNFGVGVFSPEDIDKLNLDLLFSMPQAIASEEDTSEEDIWYVDPSNGTLYYSNGDSGCTDAQCGAGFGPSEPKMCHIITGGSITTTDSNTWSVNSSASGEISMTGGSATVTACVGGTGTIQPGSNYNWVPGTMWSCPSGTNPFCNWKACS